MKRTIVIGDVHGCYDELMELLDLVKVTPEDQLISVGDLVCKGPSTKKVLDWAMKAPNLRCVLGNHEMHLLRFWNKTYQNRSMKGYQQEAFHQFGDKVDVYMNFIKSWPLYIDEPDFTVVHAGFRPGIALNEQDIEALVHIRTLEPGGQAWYEAYKENKLVVHGHWAIQGLTVLDNVIGLDSGCVYGKELSAVILPERRIVQVKARKVYCPVS